jgi:choline dehydrogenase-like flavoprotein
MYEKAAMTTMKQRKIHDAAALQSDLTLNADVVIVGTGAGGGFTAEVLTLAGLSVVMIEEGRYHTARTFVQNEAQALPALYQEAGAQRTKDQAITVLQGRSVGGGTTVNWTTCLSPPEQTLAHWRDVHGLTQMSPQELAPYLAQVRERLNVNPWTEVPPTATTTCWRKAARSSVTTMRACRATSRVAATPASAATAAHSRIGNSTA